MTGASPPDGGYRFFDARSLNQSAAGVALTKIGRPADVALTGILKQDRAKPAWEISLMILKDIEGSKCLKVILEDALATERDPGPKENLQAALKKLAEMK
jgi:hypothetical protein